jgi:multidrug efflux pump subunit AcrA (membrane-fusion protein)
MPETVALAPQQRSPGIADPFERAWRESGSGENAGNLLKLWLRMQCEQVAGTRVGLLVQREGDSTTYRSVASWPGPHDELPRLATLAQEGLSRGQRLVVDDPGASPNYVYFIAPVGASGGLPMAAVSIAVDRAAAGALARDAILRQLGWGSGWLEALTWRQATSEGAVALEQARAILDLVALTGENRRLASASLAVANELNNRFGCSRVSVGTVARGHIRLTAISHSATFDRRSQFARGIENAMEEAFHQNRTVAEPPVGGDQQAVVIAHRELMRRGGLESVATCVLAGREGPIGALTLERENPVPFSEADLRFLEAMAALLGPAIELHVEREHWIAGRGAIMVRQWMTQVAGPERPALKLAMWAAVVVPLLLLIIPGNFEISSKSSLEGQVQRALVAPFDGFIQEAGARAGDVVRAGQVIARLDDRDAVLEQTRWQSELQTLQAKYADAMATHERPDVMILGAQMRQAQAQLDLAQEELARTRVTAPFDGVIVTGDLSQVLGSPVERGKTLFEIAPLDRYRLIIQVDERDIRYIRLGERGSLVLNGLPSEKFAFTVSKVTPIATSDEGRTYFRVEGALARPDQRLRPGMEGIARVDAGRRPLLWIWTRSLVDWIRITLWQWLP